MAGPIQLVQVKIELGHKATFRKKPTAEGFTHDWQVFVKGPGRCEIHHFIEKVVFHLHESFPKPKRVVKEAPYQVSESGYAGFNLPIEIYFKNKEEPKKLGFSYDLFLQAPGAPPVNHCRCEKLTFQNPTEQFKEKLLKAGGVCSRKHEPNQNDVDPVGDGKSKKSSSSKSTVKSESSRNNQSDSQAEAAMSKPFADLFGPPIRTESKKTKSNGSVKDKTKAKSYTSTCSGNVAHKEPKYLGSSSNVSSKEKQHTKDGLSHQKRPSEESPADEHVNKKIKISTSSNDSKDEKLCSSEKDYSKVRNKEKTKEKHRDKSRERERKHKSKNRERGHSSKDKDERSRSDKKEKHVDSLSKEDNFKCSSTEKAEMKLSVSDLDFDDFNDSNSPLDIGSGTSSMTAINSLMADPENDDDDGGGGGDVGGDDDEIFISSLSSPQHSAECSPLKGKLMKKSVSKSKLESINVSVEKIKLCSESGKSLAKKSKEHKKLKETKKCKDSSKDHKDSKDQRDKENRELKPKEQKEREIKDLKVKEEKDVRVQKDRDSKEQKDTGGNREQNVKDNKKERESKERREKDLKNEKHLKKKEKKEQKKESKKIKDQKENKKDEKQKEFKKDRENKDEKEKDGKKGKEDKEQKDKEGREQKEVKRDPENIEKSCMDQDETINTKLEHRNSLDVIDVDSSDEKELRSVESNEVESLKGAELSVENKEQKCKKNKSSERKESREPDESKGRRKRLREDIKELESKELKSKEKLKKEKKHKDREKLKEHKFIKDRQKSAKERDQYKFSKSKEHKTEIESKKEHKTEVESKLAKQNWDCRSDQINNILAGDSVKSNSNSPIFDLDIVVPPVDSSSFSPLNKDASLREELMEDQSHCMKLVSPLEDTKTFSFEQCPNNSKEDAEERAENGVSVIALQDLMEKINRTTNSAFMQSVVDLIAGTGLCNLENGFIHCDLALVNDKIIQKLRSLTE